MDHPPPQPLHAVHPHAHLHAHHHGHFGHHQEEEKLGRLELNPLGMEDLLGRVRTLLVHTAQSIIHSRVFSRLEFLKQPGTEKADTDEANEIEKRPIRSALPPLTLYLHTYARHLSSVTCLCLYPPPPLTSTLLISAGGDHRIVLWSLHSLEMIHSMIGPGGVIQVLANSETQTMIVAFRNKCIVVYSLLPPYSQLLTIKTRQIEAMILLPLQPSSPSPIHHWHLYTGHQKSLRRYDYKVQLSTESLEVPCHLSASLVEDTTVAMVGRDDSVFSFVLFQSHILFTGSVANTIRVWDVRYFGTDHTIVYLAGHTARINALLVRPSHTQLLSGADDGTIRIWDILSLSLLVCLEGHTGGVTAMVMEQERVRETGENRIKLISYLYSTSRDFSIRIWDLESYETIRILKGHSAEVYCLAVLPGDEDTKRRLFTAGGDYTLKVWGEEESSREIVIREEEKVPFSTDLVKVQERGPEEEGHDEEEPMDLLCDELD